MRWSFFLLNDHTKCFIWGVKYQNTEAKRIMKKQKRFAWIINKQQRCALMHWSFFLLNDHTKCFIWGVNYRNTEAKRNMKKQKKMRLDALIIFLIEWPHQVLYLRGKLSKYWSQKNHLKKKKMRLDAMIIFLVEWPHQVLYLRGKLSKYWRQKNHSPLVPGGSSEP